MARDIRRVIALAFETPELAHAALATATRLADEDRLTIHDAVVVSRRAGGTRHVERAAAPSIAAAVPSSLVGAVIGTFVAGPLGFLIGGALAGGGAALVAKVIDTGIPHRVITELQELTGPGQTVLALLVGEVAGIAVIDQLRRFRGARVVYARLPETALEVVRSA